MKNYHCLKCRYCYNEDYCVLLDDYIDGSETRSCKEFVESDGICEDSADEIDEIEEEDEDS